MSCVWFFLILDQKLCYNAVCGACCPVAIANSVRVVIFWWQTDMTMTTMIILRTNRWTEWRSRLPPLGVQNCSCGAVYINSVRMRRRPLLGSIADGLCTWYYNAIAPLPWTRSRRVSRMTWMRGVTLYDILFRMTEKNLFLCDAL